MKKRKDRLFAFLMSVGLLQSCAAGSVPDASSEAPPKPIQPSFFEFDEGGLAIHNTFFMEGNAVVHYYSMAMQKQLKAKVVPSEQAWLEFYQTIDQLKVWQWQKEYIDPRVEDGLQWSFKIEYPGKKVDSKGSNAYPDIDGNLVLGQPYTYRTLRCAVARLFKEHEDGQKIMASYCR